MPPLLSVENLSVAFCVEDQWVPMVRNVDLAVDRGEFVGLVGESGSGKTLTALSVLRLLPPTARIQSGRILLEGHDLLAASTARVRRVRGDRIAMVFQEPISALNPVLTIGLQIREALPDQPRRRRQRDERAKHLLELVGLPATQEQLDRYPHQLSGGQRQRVMIAMALASEPEILIADEPTSALDRTLQLGILGLLADLRSRLGLAVLMITHDLAVVARTSDRCVVMYAGQVVEQAEVERLFEAPAHPYSQGLMESTLRIGDPQRGEMAPTLPGQVPDARRLPSGCSFHPRCREAVEDCRSQSPVLAPLAPDHQVRCLLRQVRAESRESS